MIIEQNGALAREPPGADHYSSSSVSASRGRGAAGAGRPRQDGQGRPLPLPAGRLGLVDVAGCQHRVGPDGEAEHVSEPVRGIYPPLPTGLKAHAQPRGGGLEGVDRRLGGFMRRARTTEFLLIPQVDPGLVADLDWGGQITEELVPGLDHGILGPPGKVGGVEIGQVIVQDPGLRRLPGRRCSTPSDTGIPQLDTSPEDPEQPTA